MARMVGLAIARAACCSTWRGPASVVRSASSPMPRHGTKPQRPIGKFIAAVQFLDARQTDQRRRLEQSRIEHRNEARAARERLDVGVAGQQADGFAKAFRSVQHRGSCQCAKRNDFT